MLKWVRLATGTLKHREEVRFEISDLRFQKTEGKRADQLGGGAEVRFEISDFRRQWADHLGKGLSLEGGERRGRVEGAEVRFEISEDRRRRAGANLGGGRWKRARLCPFDYAQDRQTQNKQDRRGTRWR
jgi:cold shock CspA family protein